MESRVLWAFLLSLIILMGWQFIFPPPPPMDKPETTSAASSSPTQQASIPDPKAIPSGFLSPTTDTLPAQVAVLSNDKVELTVSTAQGGGLHQVILKNFFETPSHQVPYPLFMIGKSGPLFRVWMEHSDCFQQAPKLQRSSDTEAHLLFVCASGQSARMTYVLGPEYHLTLHMDFSSPSQLLGKELWVSFPIETGRKPHLSTFNTEQVVYAMGQTIKRLPVPASGLSAGDMASGTLDWFSFGDRYFFVGLLSPEQLRPIAIVPVENPQLVFLKFLFPKGSTSPPTLQLKGYMGPKDRSLLQGLGTLDRVIDFGFFTVLAVPIWYFLKFFYAHLWANFGWAIIVLTILVRLLFLPLTLKGMGNMKAMQQLQPHIQKLKEKHAQDRQKLNQEMMLLMRAHKVNPLGGCLPILIQIPVFIALYAVLSNAVELYQAHFGLWIHDLSAKDPYYVLPILLGISFLVQQKLTPSAVDPATQKIMMIMPIVFTVFMINLPSGLNLYIFTSTVLGIIQQVVMNRKTNRSTA